MYICLYVKNPLFFTILNNFNFLGRFSKNSQIPNFMKICQMRAELFHVNRERDGQT